MNKEVWIQYINNVSLVDKIIHIYKAKHLVPQCYITCKSFKSEREIERERERERLYIVFILFVTLFPKFIIKIIKFIKR